MFHLDEIIIRIKWDFHCGVAAAGAAPAFMMRLLGAALAGAGLKQGNYQNIHFNQVL